MQTEETITFAIRCNSTLQTEKIELLEYDTVEQLKIKIHILFDIPPHKQIIEGWINTPEDVQTILQSCAHINRINYLTLKSSDGIKLENVLNVLLDEDAVKLEIEAIKSCFRKVCANISTSHVKFNIATLEDGLEHSFKSTLKPRKVILLYMHSNEGNFAEKFFKLLNTPEISEILIKSFFVIGWDVGDRNYHEALCKALKKSDLEHLCNFVETNLCTAIIIQKVNGETKTQAVIVEETPEDLVLKYLSSCRDFLNAESKEIVEKTNSAEDEMNSTAFQKIMADRLGDRDYDLYEFDQHEHLKSKIGYALFGPPQEEDGYGEKEKKKIEDIYNAIKKNSDKFAECKEQVEMSCIFNCTEPLPKDKTSRKKKNPEYKPDSDILPVPVFVLRKCRGSENPCRTFIDDIGRTYESWSKYIKNNKLDKCIMVLPTNGKYSVEGESVLLERHESPSCSIVKKIFQAGDIVSTGGALGSGGVMLAASATAVTTIAVAPVALITAGVVGAASGVYALGRSIGHLVDRVEHGETLSFANAEARGIYFNLLAGSLGFVGAGANMAVSQLAANGVNISKGVGAAVNTIGFANIGVSGASIVNSSYDIFDQWYNNNQTPSLLSVVQLGSSILFFGNAVYSFKTCQTIVEESQARVLQDYSDSLRSNRHRKTFNKLMKETIRQNDGNHVVGQAEIIKAIKNIPNKDEVFAVLTRSNKMMNEKGVKFFASGGEITLNGQTINMQDFVIMNKQEASAFLSNLPMKTDISPAETKTLINLFSLDKWCLPNVEQFAEYAVRLIGTFGSNIQGMLLQIVHDLIPRLENIFKNVLIEIFPNDSLAIKILCMLMEYFGGKAFEFLKNYNKWRQTGSYSYYEDDFSSVPEVKTDRYIWIFVKLVRACFRDGNLQEYELKDILHFAEKYILDQIVQYSLKQERNTEKMKLYPQTPKKIPCKVCSGYYYNYD